MKKLSLCLSLCLLLFACSHTKNTPKANILRITDETIPADQQNYESFPGDPYGVRIYTLDNGLKVYISPNPERPRIQTLVVVKAGSVQDPADATGLAHYLEHMLFKGNQRIGTINYEQEQVEITKIKDLFEVLKQTSDSAARKTIYHQIDSISGVAAQFACPNEIDQLFTQIGATGTNAFTSNEYTGYINDIPANQLKNWVKIEKERYTNPVLRLFHTELEAVYEEKNRTLDNADRQLYEQFSAALFPNHNYGQQTTIGTIEHLKSPSMYAIEKYFNTYYVPNNMGIFLSGDVHPDSAFALIQEQFGQLTPKEVQKYTFVPDTIQSIRKVELSSKEAEKVMLGFKFPGAGTRASLMVELIDMLLNNSTAGLIDLHINQAQKAIGAYSYPRPMKDYTMHALGAQPLPGQKLEEVEQLLLAQIEKIKKGEFQDWLIEAVINDLKKRELQAGRSNRNRVSKMSENFALGLNWEDQLNYFEKLEKISKEELIEFAKQNYGNNYVVAYRRQKDESIGLQVEKPSITPINTRPENRSEWLKTFTQSPEPAPIDPIFVNYEEAINKTYTKDSTLVLYQENSIDELFNLNFYIPIGTQDDPELGMAADFFKLCGTDRMTLSELNEAWYRMGIDFGISVGEEESYITISGLNEQMEEGIRLMLEVLQNIKIDTVQLALQKQKIVQLRKNSLKDKRTLLWTGLKNYLIYGAESPLMSGMTNRQVEAVEGKALIQKVQNLWHNVAHIQYYGPSKADSLTKVLPALKKLRMAQGEKTFNRAAAKDKNEIFLLDFDMQQAEILLLAKKNTFQQSDQPIITLMNEYFGGSMSSIVFQELREKRALAYSVYAGYSAPKEKEDPYYVLGYIGSQADKYEEALSAILEIMQDLPYDSLKFAQAKAAIRQQYATERVSEQALLGSYLADQKLGYNYDRRKDVYEQLEEISFQEVADFFTDQMANNQFRIAIIGNSKNFDPKVLAKFGKVKSLSVDEIFPYQR